MQFAGDSIPRLDSSEPTGVCPRRQWRKSATTSVSGQFAILREPLTNSPYSPTVLFTRRRGWSPPINRLELMTPNMRSNQLRPVIAAKNSYDSQKCALIGSCVHRRFLPRGCGAPPLGRALDPSRATASK